jgi:hypothetical protein
VRWVIPGQLLVTTSDDRSARVWRLQDTGEPSATGAACLNAHEPCTVCLECGYVTVDGSSAQHTYHGMQCRMHTAGGFTCCHQHRTPAHLACTQGGWWTLQPCTVGLSVCCAVCCRWSL